MPHDRPRRDRRGRGRSWHAPATVALLIACLPAMARAEVHVAIVELSLEGQLGPDAREPVVSALAAGLRPTATHVLTPEEVTARRGAGERLDAAAHLSARVDQLEQVYTVEAELRLARDGSRLATTSLECAPCTWDEAIQTVTRAGRGLAAHLPGRVAIEVAPAEATLLVDGEAVEPVDGGLLLGPGSHLIEARHPGRAPERREVTVVAGGATSMSISLSEGTGRAPGGGSDAGTQGIRASWLSAWITLGASVAALVPGVLWLALDGRCPIDWGQEDGICPEVYDLWPQGLAMTVVGAALLSTSVTLFVVDSYRRGRARSVSMMAGPLAHGGGAVQVVGTF